MTDEFKLTSKQWGAVETEMTTFGHLATDQDRVEIESICHSFVQRRIFSGKSLPKPGHTTRQWQAVHDAAQRLLQVMKADSDICTHISLTFRLPGEASSIFMRLLDALPTVAKDMADFGSRSPRTPNASDPELDYFQKLLISFWSVSGGRVGSSMSQDGTTPGGPLVRFLEVTYSPALAAAGMRQPSGDSLRKIIRKIKAEMEGELIESLYQVAAGESFTSREILATIDDLRRAGRLTVSTMPLDSTASSQAKWPDWWVVTAPGYWSAALDCWLNSMKITDAAGLDAWLERKVKSGDRILPVPTSEDADLAWMVINPVWPVDMMQSSA